MARHSIKSLYLMLLFVPFVLHIGCASSYRSRGQSLLEAGEYQQAIRQLKLAIVEDYRDIEAIRDMGISVYHAGKASLGQAFLRLAYSRIPEDPVTTYYLGLTYEEMGEIDKAIQMYGKYTNLGPFNSFRKQIEGRLLVLLRRRMEEQVKAMLAQEAALDVASIPDNSIAVLYFSNISDNSGWEPLQKGLTEMVITDLSQIAALTVVERARLQQLMEEMGLGMTGLVAENTAPRMGKLLGASLVVKGTLTGTEQIMRIDAGLSDIKTNRMLTADRASGPLEEFYRLEKDLIFNLVNLMGIQLTSRERRAIEEIPTKNLLAFMAYCRGLDYEDKGLWDQARTEYQSALNYDGKFHMAQSGMDRLEAFSGFSPRPPRPVRMANLASRKRAPDNMTATPRPLARAAGGIQRSSETLNILSRTAANVTAGFIPSVESRKPTTEESGITFGSATPIEIKVHLPVKK